MLADNDALSLFPPDPPVIANYRGSASLVNTYVTRTTPSLKYRTFPGEEAPRRLMLADGGLRENTGIIALLLQVRGGVCFA
jgi:hypothetical protein